MAPLMANAPRGDGRTIAALIGAGALLAWFILLWQIFGDVL
jgi:hypothetical protein